MLPAVPTAPTPTSGEYASAHQPSNSERLMPPLTSTFMPLVPLASQGRRGVLIQTSNPLHHGSPSTACRSRSGRTTWGPGFWLADERYPFMESRPDPARSSGWALPAMMSCTGAQDLPRDAVNEPDCAAAGSVSCRSRSGAQSPVSMRRDSKRCFAPSTALGRRA